MALLRRGSDDDGHAPKRYRATITAAAKRTRLGPGEGAKALRGMAQRQPWHDDAWGCFDAVPEVKHSVWFTGNAMSKLGLYAAVRLTPEATPIPVDDPRANVPADIAASAKAEIERLSSARGGVAELLRALNMNLEIAGLGYLIGRGARDERLDPLTGRIERARPETWEIRSVLEVELKVEQRGQDEVTTCRLRDAPGAQQEVLDSGLDTFTAIWQAHPGWSGTPDCHMRAVITDCRALQMLTGQVLAEAASAMPAEILTMPNELSFQVATDPEAGDVEEAIDPTVEPTDDSEAGPDPLDEALDDHLSESIEDPTSMATFRPLILRGPAEYLKPDYVRTVSLRRGGGADLEARIKARVDRLARGINLPVEVVMGHQATTFSNAEQVDEDTFEDYLEPRCEMVVDALTHAYLRPNMLDAYGTAPEDRAVEVAVPEDVRAQIDRVIVWYDADRIRASADTSAGADEALRNFAISLAAYRKAKGFTEDDAPEPLELLIQAGLRRGILTADLTKALLELLGQPIEVEALPSATPEEQAAAETEARMARLVAGLELLDAAGRGQHRAALVTSVRDELVPRARARSTANPGARLLAIDTDLRTRLLAASDSAVGRALELAGRRLRAKNGPTRATLKNVPDRLCAATLGRTIVTELLGDADPSTLLDDAFGELERQFFEWGSAAQAEALEVVNGIVGGFSTEERRMLGLRQAEDLAEGWRWLDSQLRTLSTARMFEPDVAAPALGEFDATLRVPTGMVRQAIARSGGAAAVTTEGGGAWVALVDNGTRPAGGIGTGELLRGEMRDHGVSVEAYQWVYGPARRTRPFEPHADLDGLVFENFDDEILSVTGSFPETSFYMPGDHVGCICDVEPIIATPDDLDG